MSPGDTSLPLTLMESCPARVRKKIGARAGLCFSQAILGRVS